MLRLFIVLLLVSSNAFAGNPFCQKSYREVLNYLDKQDGVLYDRYKRGIISWKERTEISFKNKDQTRDDLMLIYSNSWDGSDDLCFQAKTRVIDTIKMNMAVE